MRDDVRHRLEGKDRATEWADVRDFIDVVQKDYKSAVAELTQADMSLVARQVDAIFSKQPV